MPLYFPGGGDTPISSSIVPLTDAPNIIIDGALSNRFSVTLAGNRILNNPNNLKNSTYVFTIKQDETGGRTLNYQSSFKFIDGINVALSTAANSIDEIVCNSDGISLNCILNKNFKPTLIVAPGSNLTYVSDGDANGLLYWLGTNESASSWVNPQSIGTVVITASSVVVGSLTILSDRATGSFATDDLPNSFVKIKIARNAKLICNYYSIRAWSDNSHYLRSWKLEGSNDDSLWTILDTQSNNTSLDTVNEWLSLPVTSNSAYQYFRFTQTSRNSSGFNNLMLGEIELYGNFS